jgi:hypothetical protein
MSSHAAARKKCKSMTGLWFTQGPQFEQWLNSPNSFVWIYGIREFAKCIMSLTADIERLKPGVEKLYCGLCFSPQNSQLLTIAVLR